jgi:acyl-CoA hydrolase
MVGMKDLEPIGVPELVPDSNEAEVEYVQAQQRRNRRLELKTQLGGKKRSLDHYRNDMSTTKTPSHSFTSTTELVLPEFSNHVGYTFGGQIMRWMHRCAWVTCVRHARQHVVFASTDQLNFVNPTQAGDVLNVSSVLTRVFGSSMEVYVTVETKHPGQAGSKLCNDAYVTMVAVDDAYRPAKVKDTLVLTNKEEEDEHEAGAVRRVARLASRRELY